jgi:hypothetical protein
MKQVIIISWINVLINCTLFCYPTLYLFTLKNQFFLAWSAWMGPHYILRAICSWKLSPVICKYGNPWSCAPWHVFKKERRNLGWKMSVYTFTLLLCYDCIVFVVLYTYCNMSVCILFQFKHNRCLFNWFSM